MSFIHCLSVYLFHLLRLHFLSGITSFFSSLVDHSNQDINMLLYGLLNFFWSFLFHTSASPPTSSFLDSASTHSKTPGENIYCLSAASSSSPLIPSSHHTNQSSYDWTPEQSTLDPSFPEALSSPLHVGMQTSRLGPLLHLYSYPGWSHLSCGFKYTDDLFIYLST